jgi:hypothetical protein
MDIQSKVRHLTNRHLEHHKFVGRGVSNLHMSDELIDLSNLKDIEPSKGLGRMIGGYSWEQFLDDTDEAVTTGARIARPFLGLGKKGTKATKPTKRGGKVEPNLTKGEPVQNLTIQHIRDRKQDLYSPDGVMFSQYTPPEEMRDQSVRPDMPLDQTEVVKPKPPMTQWQAFKKAIMIIPHALGALAGGEKPKPKRKYVKKNKTEMKGGNILKLKHAPALVGLGKKDMKGGVVFYDRKTHSIVNTASKSYRNRKKPVLVTSTLAPVAPVAPVEVPVAPVEEPAPVAPVTPVAPATIGAGKKQKKMKNPWIEHVKSYAKKNNMKYSDALKDAKCKSSYKYNLWF